MPLDRLLQINMAAMAALGALLLGMGERSAAAPLLVIAVAVASVWLTDVTGRFCLGQRVANALMLVAAAFSLGGLLQLRSELQALNFAWLLIWLQIILLFQRKDGRIYWLLVMLSLLQVVVATLFNQGVWFGALLVIYMLSGFSTMMLLLAHRQSERQRNSMQRPAAEHGAAAVGAAASPRWPLAAETSEFYGTQVGGEAAINADLYGRLGRMSLATLGLTAALFFAFPRFGQFGWRNAAIQPQSTVGFSEKVSLGELGEIVENRDEVMRLWFYQYPGDAPQPVQGEIYLQGGFLMLYRHGEWQIGQASFAIGKTQLRPERPRPRSGLVRQKIRIEGLDRNELFYVAPYVALAPHPNIEIDCPRNRLCRDNYWRKRQCTYELGTTAIVGGRQSPWTPADEKDVTSHYRQAEKEAERDMPQLVALARRWIKESGLPEQDRVGRARYIERQLASSGRFQYSLVGQQRDPEIDPIEDFVTKHPLGHCEYFATALVLMLRSQGIPARLVTGYKVAGDDWNAMGGYYQVRQLHAHAWAEAYIRPSQVPEETKHARGYWKNWESGAWLRLDATPAGEMVAGVKNWLSPVRRVRDWLDSAWSNYVVELDFQRQRDAVYQPVAAAAKWLWREGRNLLNSVTVALYLNHLNREVRWLLLIVVATTAVVAVLLLGRLIWRMGRRWFIREGRNGARLVGRRNVSVEFYRRLETLLARRGLVRSPGQTQREFAAVAGDRLAAIVGESRLSALTTVVAEAFYCVRFGRTPLDSRQIETVEHALREIAATPSTNYGNLP